jgi:hypothetical protein
VASKDYHYASIAFPSVSMYRNEYLYRLQSIEGISKTKKRDHNQDSNKKKTEPDHAETKKPESEPEPDKTTRQPVTIVNKTIE